MLKKIINLIRSYDKKTTKAFITEYFIITSIFITFTIKLYFLLLKIQIEQHHIREDDNKLYMMREAIILFIKDCKRMPPVDFTNNTILYEGCTLDNLPDVIRYNHKNEFFKMQIYGSFNPHKIFPPNHTVVIEIYDSRKKVQIHIHEIVDYLVTQNPKKNTHNVVEYKTFPIRNEPYK